MKKIILSTLAIFMFACSQNAHLTRPDTSGDNSGLSQKPGDTVPPAKMKVTLEDVQQGTKLFSGLFLAEGNLNELSPAEVESDSVYRWDQFSKYFQGRAEGDIAGVEFEKVNWAKESNEHYQLFDATESYVLAEGQRGVARSIKMTVTQTIPGKSPVTKVVVYPVQYRYSIDDEALNQGRLGRKNDVYYVQGLVPGRYVRGLEYVSNRNLLYRNINCHNGYDFIDTYVLNGRNNFKARVTARRNQAGTWIPFQQTYSTLLGAVGFGLTNKRTAYFSDVLDYGGNCTFKVQGLMSVKALNSEIIDGIRVELIAQNGEKGYAEFGVTVLEAY
tara:strand:- start:2005 stop:2994 length:990 start_codon:yes stop_codon:yes gene_type:complete